MYSVLFIDGQYTVQRSGRFLGERICVVGNTEVSRRYFRIAGNTDKSLSRRRILVTWELGAEGPGTP